LSEKIIKIRKYNNLDRIKLGEAIGHYWSYVQQWELNEVYPKPNSIKDICDTFNVDLKYFGDYYYWVFNDPGNKFKETSRYSYSYYTKLFDVSDSNLKRIVSGKIQLSYSMYLKFKELGVFESSAKTLKPNYTDIPIKFKAWKSKMGYN